MASLIHKYPDGTEKNIELSDKPLIVGRLSESEIQVRDSFISRKHCSINYSNQQFQLKDLGSANGTYRNGTRVFECALVSGDLIQVGNATLAFEIDSLSGNGILTQNSKPAFNHRNVNLPSPASLPSQPAPDARG